MASGVPAIIVPGVIIASGVSPIMAVIIAVGVSPIIAPEVPVALTVGASVLIVGSETAPTASVGVEPAPGTTVFVVLVVVGVAVGPQAASNNVPITRKDAIPVNLFFPVLLSIVIANRSS